MKRDKTVNNIREIKSIIKMHSVESIEGRFSIFYFDVFPGVNRQWTEGRFTLTNVDAPFKLKFVAKKLVRGKSTCTILSYGISYFLD